LEVVEPVSSQKERAMHDRKKAQKDRITKAVHKLNAGAVVQFEDHGRFIRFCVLAANGTPLLPHSEDREPEFYDRLSEEELEKRIRALSNNRL
jgi:hypothetical protein